VPLAPDGERGDLWDFGYALTVHKAQGSQAERVLVFEERFAKSSDDDWRRWLYTAVTRAELELTVVGPDVFSV
jgi:exodeoxyribonuclease-5